MSPPSPTDSAGSDRRCESCGALLPARLLACPSCQTLVHKAKLKELAARATQAESGGDIAGAVELWARMVELLPPGSLQHQHLSEMLASGRERLDKDAAASPTSPKPAATKAGMKKKSGLLVGLGVVGVLLLKFKWVLLFALGKGKLLLLGLLQAKTFLSMGVALWVYIMAWGWKFAAGLVVSIYIHEMGHVAWLRRYGIPATAPMFIPGVGAFVRMKSAPRSPAQDARVGMAGPLWGLLAAAGFLAVGAAASWPAWYAIAAVGAWINIFNLLPVWQLDGGRAWNALSRRERGWATAALWLLALLAGDGLFFIIAIAGSLRTILGRAPDKGDRGATYLYIALVGALTLLIHFAKAGAR
jgi:Zn-dependent protease